MVALLPRMLLQLEALLLELAADPHLLLHSSLNLLRYFYGYHLLHSWCAIIVVDMSTNGETHDYLIQLKQKYYPKIDVIFWSKM
jgi:hypothetical protein